VHQPARHCVGAADLLLEERPVTLGHPFEEGDDAPDVGAAQLVDVHHPSHWPSSQPEIPGIDAFCADLPTIRPTWPALKRISSMSGSTSMIGLVASGGMRWSASPMMLTAGQSIERRSTVRPPISISPRTSRSSFMNHSTVWRKHAPGNGMWSCDQPISAWWAAM